MTNRQFGLLGEHLAHSFSPRIHGELGDYDYKLFEVAPCDLEGFMEERAFDGLNVTIPYKQAVMKFCETISDEARAIGCVNTITKDESGALHGYNTDYYGFERLILSYGEGISPVGRKVLVLGDGGAARTVRAVLGDLGAASIVTISRRGEDNYDNIARHFDADLIVNTTPVGMYPNNGEAPLSLEGFTRLGGVIDLIYNPLRTALLLEAERLGLACAGGLLMLTAQAEMASRLFIKAPPRPELALDIERKLLADMENIALIGMPGCGKSSAGRKLASMTGREFVDVDELVEELAGKKIPQIFTDVGEAGFRELETRALSEASKENGRVIATGGGVVMRDFNFDLLRQNSRIVYLRRDLGSLPSGGRPLSQSVGIKELARQRLPLYEAWCNSFVDVDSDPAVTARRVLQENVG